MVPILLSIGVVGTFLIVWLAAVIWGKEEAQLGSLPEIQKLLDVEFPGLTIDRLLMGFGQKIAFAFCRQTDPKAPMLGFDDPTTKLLMCFSHGMHRNIRLLSASDIERIHLEEKEQMWTIHVRVKAFDRNHFALELSKAPENQQQAEIWLARLQTWASSAPPQKG